MGGPDSTGRSVRDPVDALQQGTELAKIKFMKLKDIEVGKEYSNSYEQKVLVLEVGVYGQVYPDHRWVHSVQSDRKDYVLVRTPYDHEERLHCRSIKHDWETQEKIDKSREKKEKQGTARADYLRSILRKYVPGLREKPFAPTMEVFLDTDDVEKICEAFVSHGKDRT